MTQRTTVARQWSGAFPLREGSSGHALGWRLAVTALLCLTAAISVRADVTVGISGPGGTTTRVLPDSGGAFDANLPLNTNSVNNITVTASDTFGNTASKQIQITQVSLESVVISQFVSQPLPPERVVELVNQGVIRLDDPQNYNVSQFDIVLTIGERQVPISVPIAVPVQEEDPSGYEIYRLPFGADSGGGRQKQQPVEIVVFEKTIPSEPGKPTPPPIPGVIIIEGRIKSLKEFFSCRLLLMNASGIFTLSNVMASLAFPDGGLSNVLPTDGIVSFGDILPGDGGTPGQVEKEFIIRGDEIGVRHVKVSFGGVVKGPGIPEDSPIPFNGSAVTEVEVKGPPTFLVQVTHPDSVKKDEPYELKVDITNTGETPALYASLDLDVGGDAEFVKCEQISKSGDVDCETVKGPISRALGHLYPGETTSQTFTINPLRDGAITSCMGVSSQNISLQVFVGNLGCVVGHFPPERKVPDGIPTVTVLPVANASGIGVDSPVAAFFSEKMMEDSITTGAAGTFNVYNKAGDLLPGVLRFETVMNKTVAIWQFRDDITNRLAPETEYTVFLSTGITDTEGNALFSEWTSTFTTTGTPLNDNDPPQLTLSIAPPVLPNYVLPGQIVRVHAYATDQASGVVRVEARLKDLDDPQGTYTLIDQRSVLLGDTPPYIFSIDSAKLALGHSYQIMCSAYDYMGNMQNATISMTIADSAAPPTILLPESPISPFLHGISVDLTPVAMTGGVREIRFYLDGAAEPFATSTLSPYQMRLNTLGMTLGSHNVLAVAVDGLNQTGEDTLSFELVENLNMPTVSFGNAVDGAQYVTGASFVVRASAEDPVGIESVFFYLDSAKAAPIAQGTDPFVVDTAGLSLGNHTILIVATNKLGISNDPNAPESVLEFSVVEPPPGPPPAAPTVTNVSYPANGKVTVQGTTVSGARVDVTNTTLGISTSVYANASGAFSAVIEAEAGHVLRLIAYNFSQSPNPSAPTTVTVQAAPILQSIEVSPKTISFTSYSDYRDLSVTGHYQNAPDADVRSQATFTSSAPGIAAVNSAGRVAPIANGQTTITVNVNGYQDTVAVTVNIVTLESISVDPSSLTMVTLGQTQQLTVTGRYNDGSSKPVTNATFVSGNPAVVTVNASGLVRAVGNGTATVTVFVSSVTPVTAQFTVATSGDPAPTISILAPATGTQVERGSAVNLTVKAEDAFGGVNAISVNVTGAMTASQTRQVSPPALSTTQSFVINVPNTATIGGTILITVRAEDTGANLSTPASVSLTVVDRTAPSVQITAPAPGTAYNFGDTIVLSVQASDAVGVTQIRYVTTGGLALSGSRTISPPATSTSTSFSITVPYNASDPDVTLRAYARDAAGNEGASVTVDIRVTSADITPPATVVTSVSNPGSGSNATVYYQVTSGLEDLDHIELYFRRNGIGTFNRFTDADSGNSLGEYTPQSGSTGTILFKSTKMGGDGAYEFFTVGVDEAGNREAPPNDGAKTIIGDTGATATFNTGAEVVEITTSQEISSTTYDNRNLRINGAQIVLVGSHSFKNVELINGAVLKHRETTLTEEPALSLTVWTLSIDSTSSINVDTLGYLGGRRGANSSYDQGRTRSETETNILGSTAYSGGAYGGTAGRTSGTPNEPYGSIVDPVDLGSGGGCGSYGRAGGNGGGRVDLHAVNVTCDGAISSNGGTGNGYTAGSGSGGSIKITTSTLSGLGPIRANGGGGEVGGGGGRVGIFYVDVYTLDTSLVRALGGQSGNPGGNGTVFMRGVNETNGTLVFDGQGASTTFSTLPIPPGFVFDNIIIRNNARVIADDPIVVNDSVQILTGSILTHSNASEAGLSIEADEVVIDETSSIDVSGRGYPGGLATGNSGHNEGVMIGGLLGASAYCGGSYGGYGGQAGGTGPNAAYGHPASPDHLGAGGGCGSYGRRGGNGGGRIHITAESLARVDGKILANGETGTGFNAGSGSGGSIKIETSFLRGTGSIEADGGANEVGGGGGRIDIVYDGLAASGNDLGGLLNVHAFGGHASYPASAGTVLMSRSDQEIGDLYVDDGYTNATAPNWTPLTPVGYGAITALTSDTLTTDGNVVMIPNALIGVEFNPNLNQSQTFVVVANTENTLTVDASKGPKLTDVAAVGDHYAGVWRFDNVYFRRGGYLVLGDQLVVNDTLYIAEKGRLDSYDATTTFEPRVDITAGTIEITADSSINVDARGYLGGLRLSNSGNNEGRTLNNALGSTPYAGGSYGGLGGYASGRTPNGVYGNLTNPAALGSGGGGGSYGRAGGDGGGWVALRADTVVINGAISANGVNGTGYDSAGGSGGTININASSIEGVGVVRANGGGTEVGGGGGRVAFRYDTLTFDSTNIEAFGGQAGDRTGGNGTIFLKRTGQTYGDLIIDGSNGDTPSDSTPIPPGLTFDNITLNNARITADVPLIATGNLELLNNTRLTHTTSSELGLRIQAGRIEIDATSRVDVSGRGYLGGLVTGNPNDQGRTLGNLVGAGAYAGGTYGGYGGVNSSPQTNPPYGRPAEPLYLGSGGGCGSYGRVGGNGGGLVDIRVTGELIVEGKIQANGTTGTGYAAGSGSGGSIRIQTVTLRGTGSIEADGGANEVGGGGGRIAIRYTNLGGTGQDLGGLRNIHAFGGHGNNQAGSAGTVLLKKNTQTYGDLYIDDAMDNATASNWTPFTRIGPGTIQAITKDTLTMDGNVPTTPNALAGLEINPNTAQDTTFTIVSNTANTITVNVSGGTDLTDVAAVGDVYLGVNRFDNVYFRRGGYLVLGDSLVVSNNVLVDEYGRIDHHDATTTYEAHIDLTCGTLNVTESGSIRADSRGYLGGLHGSNSGNNEGRTLGNALGSRYRSGGSYGGLGAYYDGTPGPVYGLATDPAALGSGGSCGAYGRTGGDGGGWVDIHATNVTVDGVISVGGGIGANYQAGSGSGGTIRIEANTIRGTGVIAADGGVNEVGGGGGRIALIYGTFGGTGDDFNDLLDVHAFGGHGGNASGSAGTVVVRQLAQPNGDLYIDDNMTDATAPNWTPLTRLGPGKIQALTADTLTTDGNVTLVPNGLVGLSIRPNRDLTDEFTVVANTENTITVDATGGQTLTDVAVIGDTYQAVHRFDNVYFRRGGYLVLGEPLRVSGEVIIDDYARLDHYDATTTYEAHIDLVCGHLTVSANSAINVTARGYLGGQHGSNSGYNEGRWLDNALGSTYRSGGSFGGLGGAYDGTPNATYSLDTNPSALGAGGSCGAYGRVGGDGGGWVAIRANSMTINGLIKANGGTGDGHQAGSGSGGTVNLKAPVVSGTGNIQADGGAFEVGGGGGRIAIEYDTSLSNLLNLTTQTLGGDGSNADGSAGTVRLIHRNQASFPPLEE